jgi:hypothetical protein
MGDSTNGDQNADQWRIDNAHHLAGLYLHFRRYTRWSESWDHDHCAACWAKFAEYDGPEIVHEGYATGPDYPRGADYEWVCPECFTDLAGILGWRPA